jgi:hypothetical protein
VKEGVAVTVGTEDIYPSLTLLLFICMALVLAVFLVSLDMTIVPTAIPRITDEFKSLDQESTYHNNIYEEQGSNANY